MEGVVEGYAGRVTNPQDLKEIGRPNIQYQGDLMCNEHAVMGDSKNKQP